MEVPGSADRSLDETGQWKNTREEKKEQSRSGYRLLAEMIKKRYAYDLEKETDSVMRTETGKPYLRLHPELFFNISHSGEWIACVLGNVPVGIDIQYHREIKLEQTARKICTPDEWKTFMQAGTEKGKKDFLFQIWTKKESYLKFTGDGIRRELCEISYEGCRFYRLVMPEGYSGWYVWRTEYPMKKVCKVTKYFILATGSILQSVHI